MCILFVAVPHLPMPGCFQAYRAVRCFYSRFCASWVELVCFSRLASVQICGVGINIFAQW